MEKSASFFIIMVIIVISPQQQGCLLTIPYFSIYFHYWKSMESTLSCCPWSRELRIS